MKAFFKLEAPQLLMCAFVAFITVAAFYIATISTDGYFLAITGLLALLAAGIYFIYVLHKPKAAIPFIILSFWFVVVEPSLCDVLAGIAIFALFLHHCTYQKKSDRVTFAETLLLLFVVMNISNLFFTKDLLYSLKYVSITIYLFLLYFFFSRTPDSVSEIHKYLKLYLIASLISCLAMFVGYFLSIGYISSPFLSEWLLKEARPSGFFKDPNVAGPFLIPAATFCIASIGNSGKKAAILYLISFSALSLGVLLSFSRASMIAFFAAIAATLFTGHNFLKKAVILTVIFFIVGIFTVQYAPRSELAARLVDIEYGVTARLHRIKSSISISPRNYLTGTGMDLPLNEAAHDTIFLLFSQLGIIGLASFWIPVLYVNGKTFLHSRGAKEPEERIVCSTLSGSLASFLCFAFLINFIHWRHFWFVLGLSAVTIRMIENSSQKTFLLQQAKKSS